MSGRSDRLVLLRAFRAFRESCRAWYQHGPRHRHDVDGRQRLFTDLHLHFGKVWLLEHVGRLGALADRIEQRERARAEVRG